MNSGFSWNFSNSLMLTGPYPQPGIPLVTSCLIRETNRLGTGAETKKVLLKQALRRDNDAV